MRKRNNNPCGCFTFHMDTKYDRVKLKKIQVDRTRKIAYKPRGPRMAKSVSMASLNGELGSYGPPQATRGGELRAVPFALQVDLEPDLPFTTASEPSKEGDLPLTEAHKAPREGDESNEALIRPKQKPFGTQRAHPHGSIVQPHGAKVDLAKAIDLRYKHRLSVREIADYFGVAPNTVSSRLKRYLQHLPNMNEVKALDSIRGDVVRGVFYKNLINLSDPTKLKKASLNNVAYSTAQLHNMLRLEEGKSTQNVFTADYFAYIKEQARRLPKENLNDINTDNV